MIDANVQLKHKVYKHTENTDVFEILVPFYITDLSLKR